MNYTNPNEFWSHNDSELYKDCSDDERTARTICAVMIRMLAIFVLLCVIGMCSSCTTTKYVPVTEQHTEHHWHTDSVKERDSVHTENTTIIREVDSAAMAKYGIQMQANQRAWLVLQREMENHLRELEHMTATRDTIHDSIPVPVPVEVIKEVPAELTWWQQTRLHLANIMLWLLLLLAVIYVGKKYLARLNH